MKRLLLPFTHGIDASAVAYALQIARYSQAVLVGVAIISHSHTGPRLGDIEQATDFLELLSYQAKCMQVPLERMELYSRDSAMSIQALYKEMDCSIILTFMREGKGVLLMNEDLQCLLSKEDLPVFLVRLTGQIRRGTIKERLLSWWNKGKRQSVEEAILIQVSSLHAEKLDGVYGAIF